MRPEIIEHLENKGLISQKTNAVYDYQFIKTLRSMPWADWIETPEGLRCAEEFLAFYPRWIARSRLNKVEGLERFSRRHVINGTTQSFDEFYFRFAGRRLRFFRGEYAYHRRVVNNWLFLEDAPLATGDVVIVSAPFCSTGDVHSQFYELLTQATNLEVPVLVDCAYFGTCENFTVNLNYPCIESVSFSLSKGTGLGDIRSGIRFSHYEDDFPIAQQNRYNHTILGAAKIGLYMMQHFSPDFIPTKYSAAQKAVCAEYGLTPTKCMHLALADDSGPWEKYIIDGTYRRVGIRALVKAKFKNEV